MAAYFDTDTRSIKRKVYEWADADGTAGNQWDDLTSWETGTGSYYTLQSGDPLTYLTPIQDYGRIAYINPTCTADVVGDNKKIEVFVADSIDSSSQIGGEAAIEVTGPNQVLNGTYGRYYQFRISVDDTTTQLAEIFSVRTDLSNNLQQEIVVGDSSTHSGTIAARIAPLTKEYSRIAGVVGNAKATSGVTPYVTIGNNTSQAVYTVYDFTEPLAGDSSTITTIADYTGQVTITEHGSVSAVEDEYVWQPSSVRFNTNNGANAVTDTNDKISFTAPSTSTPYTYEMWKKIWQNPGTSAPGLEHSEYFIKIPTTTTEIRMRTNTDSSKVRLDISTDGGSTWINGPVGNSNIGWKHIALVSDTNFLLVFVDGVRQVFPGVAFNQIAHSGLPSGTVEIGDLGTSAGNWWMDDFRISNYQRYSTNFSTPGEFVEDVNTKMLINGVQEIVTGGVAASIQPVDAVVNLLITGLPKLISDSNSDIREEL